jgi:hypothetical protein
LDQIVLLEPDVHFVGSVGIEQATPKTKAKFDDTRNTNENQKYDCEYFGTTLHNSFGDPGYIFDIFTFCGNRRPVKIRCNFHVNSTPPPLLFSLEVAPPEGGSAGRLIPSPWKRKLQTEINKWRAPRTGNFQNNVGGKGTVVSRVQRDGMSLR